MTQAPKRRWDITCRVEGAGDDLTVTWGGSPERPDDDDQARMLAACVEQFARVFGHLHDTAAITVGPHVPSDDDNDREDG